MVQSFTEDFQVAWKDPRDAELHWSWDKMHNPRPLAPLAVDLFGKVWTDVFSARLITLNGYLYSYGFTIPPPPPEVWQRGVADIWENEYVPHLSEVCARLRGSDYDSFSAAELADALKHIAADA